MNGDALDLRTIVDVLTRRVWLILVVAAATVGATGLVLLALKPVYSATALVLVDPSQKNLLDPSLAGGGAGFDSPRVDSEVELVRSELVLLAVAEELRLAADPEFGLRDSPYETVLAVFGIVQPPPSSSEALASVMSKLRDRVVAHRRGLTFLIAVAARSERPAFAAQLANAVSRTYIAHQLDAKVASTLASAAIIGNRVAEASAMVARSEQALDSFVSDSIARIGEATGRTDFVAMRDEIASLGTLRTSTSAAVAQAERGLAERDWAAVASSLGDEAVADLQRRRLALLGDVADATEGSQTATELRSSLAAIDAQLDTAAKRAVSGLRQGLSSTQGRIAELRTQLRSAILESELPSEILAGIYELQQGAEVARTQYQALLTRQNELDTQVHLQVPDSRLVAAATAPDTPSFPNSRLALLLAGLVGLGLGIGLAFARENFVGGFTSSAQAESILRSPVVAAVPRQRPIRHDGGAAMVADSLNLAPLSAYSESIRRVRIGIDQALRKRRRRQPDEATEGAVIVVTSATAGEGKTTVTLSLARAYALAGLSTLVIDCDLRQPGIHKLLGVEASGGLLDYLARSTDPSDLKAILTVDPASGAQVVVGAHRSDIATDRLVAGRTFARLIAAARANFDVVLLDTPPVGPVVDGLYLAGMADAIAFVVKFSSTPQQEVRAAMASLIGAKQDDVPILTVLNQQTSDPAAYRGKHAGYYAEA